MSSDFVLAYIDRLLARVKDKVLINRNLRPDLTALGNKDYLVGVVDFERLNDLMIVKILFEYTTKDYLFEINKNLSLIKTTRYCRYYTPLPDNSLEIYANHDKKKVKTFLKFIKSFRHHLPSLLGEMRRDWFQTKAADVTIFFRQNMHKSRLYRSNYSGLDRIADDLRGEDVFWRNVISGIEPGLLWTNNGTFEIVYRRDRQGLGWNIITASQQHEKKVNTILGIVPQLV
jgi:hypothetical protein